MTAWSTLEPGTPESSWLAWSAVREALPLELGEVDRLVVVAPHPDDEVLGAAGLMRRATAEGRSIRILSVSDGEASHPGVPDARALAERRRRETGEALVRLGLDVEVLHLGLPDGRVDRHRTEVAVALAELLGPGTMCVAPWRHDGHPDHEASGAAAVAATEATGATLVEYPVWAWHWATPGAGLPAAPLRRLDLTPDERAAKHHAIDAFESQIHPLPESPDDPVVLPPAVLDRFRRAFEVHLVGSGCR